MSTFFEKKNYWRVELLGLAVGWVDTDWHPYINFNWSSAKYDFKRATVYALHRARHGWAANDVWGLDYYLADVIIGGLQELKKHHVGLPMEVVYGDKDLGFDDKGQPIQLRSDDEADKMWCDILDQICDGFKAHKQLCDLEWEGDKERKVLEAKFDKGFKLLHKYFGNLWD